jgi:8-hydroxy-5-deazaflavin:NADPH oxidoreductase
MMKIGILGSGMVGQTIGAKLAERGMDVVLGTRTPEQLDEKRGMGAPLSEWVTKVGQNGRLGTFAEAAAHGELVINATSGTGSLEALSLAGEKNLDGKILIDISNPLDFSRGMPPSLSICNTDSLGEQIQKSFPRAKVVKTLNTTTAYVMVDPNQVAGGDHDIFVSGNDAEAKQRVTSLLKEWFGWKSVIDLGDITTARGAEMLLPIWIRLWGALGTPMFNFKIAR